MNSNTEQVARFKEVLGNYPTGVTVVTTADENGTPVGLTVNSFASVSIDPLLVLWSIDRKVSSFDIFQNTDKFAIHTLADDQAEICTLFASRDIDRFANCEWNLSEHALPIISGSYGVLQCKTFKKVDAGDHLILIGEVIDIEVEKKEPLLYHKRKFGKIPEEFYVTK
ncbi:flavin reductase family protein [Peribacillus psychrosaccharolyticus]|uniref:Flavin reductase family protein n=1 Tax=Peribacillus psychrosaccharolyticus TaxID=1407 RepID=A0A974NP83_PERPY|nr:flavin reductase family protein [Peribacillus psychrosaccharolyticus]MEC2054058.1 flavin reductase family protein [Peribacillus psychrosaccharolyticus]MED3742322.1 flavin reductase family protein [Peribacillus psychrosaccharolyticus]QQT01297.1 flavin reductase family protein [Peribacillus psychrosaccharolyticus]